MAEKFGLEKVMEWRRSYATPPPTYEEIGNETPAQVSYNPLFIHPS